jgi:ubiquinone biosynthesis protein
MAISLKPKHLKRYKDIALLVFKYGRKGLGSNGTQDELLQLVDETPPPTDAEPAADELAADLEKLGPTFIKLGQLLSTRPDFLPLPYVEALARLQDNVAPFPREDVERIIASELGVRLSKAFAQFDPHPVAAASLGQVHRAVLRDGRQVAVKVQRPDIRERIVEDLEALEEIARFLDDHTEAGRRYGFCDMLDEFRKALLRELDYRQEARNLATLGENLREFDRIIVPRPVADYTTSRVLTMDFVHGRKITDLSPVTRTELDGSELARQLFEAYLKQIIVDGLVHADPHPGNVFLTDDHRIALIDLGTVTHIAPSMQEKLLQLLLAVSEGRGDEATEVALSIGERRPHYNEIWLRKQIVELVAQNQHVTVGDLQVGRIVLQIVRAAGEGGLRVPSELTMLGKTLLNLDQIGRVLDPHFDPHAAIKRRATKLTSEKVRDSLSPGNILETALELKDFFQRLPHRVNKILDLIAGNALEVRVDAIDETQLMAGFQKVANRIATGLVLAALIVGAALLMRIETSFILFGYPGFAILCFVAAAGGGVALILNILLTDLRARKSALPDGGGAAHRRRH